MVKTQEQMREEFERAEFESPEEVRARKEGAPITASQRMRKFRDEVEKKYGQQLKDEFPRLYSRLAMDPDKRRAQMGSRDKRLEELMFKEADVSRIYTDIREEVFFKNFKRIRELLETHSSADADALLDELDREREAEVQRAAAKATQEAAEQYEIAAWMTEKGEKGEDIPVDPQERRELFLEEKKKKTEEAA